MKVKLDKYGIMPTRAHSTDAGLDIYSPTSVRVERHSSTVIHTGVHIQLPHGMVGMLKSKSGLNVNHDITTEGVIDEGYTGEIVVKVYNHGWTDYQIEAGNKITQLVVMPCEYVDLELVDDIDGGERGDGGFGSTGK